MAIDYQQWLLDRARQIQAAGGDPTAVMQPVAGASPYPGFGIAPTPVTTQPANQVGGYDMATLFGQAPQVTARMPAYQPAPAPNQQQALLAAQQGGQTASSPTGFGLPPQGYSASPVANQQYAQYGQMGAASGALGGQYGGLAQTNGQRPAGTAAGAWSSSPTANSPSVPRIAAARTPDQYGSQPAYGARIQGQGVPGGAVQPQGFQNRSTTATPGGTMTGSTGVGTAPQTLQAYGAALPAPNKIVARNFTRLDPDTQDFLRSGYRATGYSDNQINQAVKQGLPQFKTPQQSGQVR